MPLPHRLPIHLLVVLVATGAGLGCDRGRAPAAAPDRRHTQMASIQVTAPPGPAQNGVLATAREDVYNTLLGDAHAACAGAEVVVSRLRISVERAGGALVVYGEMPHLCAPRALACLDGICKTPGAG